MLNADNSYQERQSEPNLGEQVFEDYCQKMGYQCLRFGFEEKSNRFERFYLVNPFLRNIPDYIVDTGSSLLVVQVKGTANIKKEEIDKMPLFLEWYSSKDAPLVYAFCFHDREKPVLVYPEKVIDLYQKATDKRWKDGKIYRTLAI